MYPDLKYQIISGVFALAGQGISGFLTRPRYEDDEKLLEEYYTEAREIVKKDEQGRERERRYRAQPQQEEPLPEIQQTDLIPEKIGGGTLCLPCSRDHFSTVSGALSEALRFARKEGINHPEVQKRIGMALDELNMLERIDLAPEQMVTLRGKEKTLAEWGLNSSRDLRHKITIVQTPDDLESAAADASNIRTQFMRQLWEVATVDGTIDKLCKGLKEEEKERCMSTIANILDEKTLTPP